MATIAITGGTLIDGSGRDPVKNATVVIEDERIVAAGPGSSVAVPKGAQVLDAAGRTVLPGIIDCHVHGTYRARDMRQHLLNAPTYNVLRSTSVLKETLACGVTTARDMGGADAGFREAINEGYIDGPRLQIAIAMVSQTGGHGDAWVPAGLRVQKRAWLPSPVADGADEVRRLVRHLLMAGADFIKICATGGITSVTDSWDEPQFTLEEIRVAVTEAAMRRKTVAVHAEGVDGIRTALAADIHSLEHGWFIDDQCVDMMVKTGTWWVPTLALVPLSLEHRKKNTAWDKQQLANESDKEYEIFDRMQKQTHRLLVGENLVEFRFMVEWLGMTPMEALVAATGRAAECIGRSDVGVLEAGRYADVLVVDGDPLSNIRILEERERIKLVMKAGRAYTNTL